MISLLTNAQTEQLTALCGDNPFGLRIISAYNSYGTSFPFCEFWLKSDENGASAAVMRLDGHITVCGVSTDTDELAAFLQAVGGSDIFAPDVLALPAPFVRRESGAVMRFEPHGISPCSAALDFSPRLEDVYRILLKSGQLEALGEHDAWYADASHRIRHGCARAAVLYENALPAACVMAVAESSSAALLGGVAVLPEYRGWGLGRRAVSAFCKMLQNENKNICLCCESSLMGFYEPLGFVLNGGWAVWDNNIR